LFLALANEKLDVRAITTTAGEIGIKRTYKNVVPMPIEEDTIYVIKDILEN